ncbi:MAG TPA: NAD(P)-binding protein [Bdellovibrionales bacterium]|nr:NAD(P)-binding protein [Bdellovibrionales bacterium]
MSSYDTIVIGGGLTGLLITHKLHQSGKSVALLEAREILGGRYRRQNLSYSSTGLDFFPATNDNMGLLEWIKANSPLPLQIDVNEHRPQLYDEGRWRPFAGFGETDFLSVGELAHFSHTNDVTVEPGLEQLTRALIEQLPIVAMTMSEVTKLTVTDGKITEITVNGDKHMKAENVVFTPFPGILNTLIEGEGLAAKNRTRLAKMHAWTAVTLELTHSPPLVEDPSIRIFTHGSKEFEPVVGRSFGETSRWLTLVPFERGTEHEFVGQCIRHIKRQLKRAWPGAFDGKPQEKIFVQSNAFGQQMLKTKDPLRFPEISNLWLANHLLAANPGEISALEMALMASMELGADDTKRLSATDDRDVEG